MRLRGVLVLAVLAALLGAPPTASAAANSLDSAGVSPSSGTPSTTFVLRVAYQGTFPAQRVDAVVAGDSLPMTRVSGTADAGTWQVSTTLPAGSWPVTFTATTDRGNSPVLAGGLVVVSAVATPPPAATPPPTPQRAPQRSDDNVDSTTPRASAAAPNPGPSETDPPAAAGGDGAPSEPSAKPSSVPGDPGTVSGGGSENDGDEAPDGGDEATPAASAPEEPESPPSSGPGSSGHPRGDGAPAEGATAPPGEAAPSDAAVGGTVGIFAAWGVMLAMAGGLVLLLVLWRRRRPGPAEASVPLADETAALLQRRALRRARTVIPDDPIVASLGIDEAALARRSTQRPRSSPDRID